MQQAERLLEEHYDRRGAYPSALDSLPFSFPGGSDKTTLADLQYKSDGKSYSLEVRGAYDGAVYTVNEGQVQLKSPPASLQDE